MKYLHFAECTYNRKSEHSISIEVVKPLFRDETSVVDKIVVLWDFDGTTRHAVYATRVYPR